jgi:hypothetical protein
MSMQQMESERSANIFDRLATELAWVHEVFSYLDDETKGLRLWAPSDNEVEKDVPTPERSIAERALVNLSDSIRRLGGHMNRMREEFAAGGLVKREEDSLKAATAPVVPR